MSANLRLALAVAEIQAYGMSQWLLAAAAAMQPGMKRLSAGQLRQSVAGHMDEDVISVGSSRLDEAVSMLDSFTSGRRATGQEAEQAIRDFVAGAAESAS